jgi:predicted AlkP superfamily pyrophosphatase or phosphodiesterase
MTQTIKFTLVTFFATFLMFSTKAQKSPVKISAINAKPKVVVGLVIDQMRWDYLYRYQNRYGKNGFSRLLSQGISYENALIPYAPTVTAAGHATIYTGAVPAIHGVVSNGWIDRLSGKYQYCADDTTVFAVGTKKDSKEGKMSPRNMFSSTIGDQLKLATAQKSRTFSIALKDRGAIFPGGHSCNMAFWLEDENAHWITSSYYGEALPTWAQSFNDKNYPTQYIKSGWNTLYPINSYTQSYKDDNAFEEKLPGEKKATFPHKLDAKPNSVSAFMYSPFANTYSFQFAKKLIEEEKLGQLGNTDMLSLSISSTDLIGHKFGAHSVEIEDTYLRLDSDIADFLSFLDSKFGTNGYLLFLSADHGVSHIPTYLQQSDVKNSGGIVERGKTRDSINDFLKAKYNVARLVKAVSAGEILLDDDLIKKNNLVKQDVEDAVVDFLQSFAEIMHVITFSRFDKAILPDNLKQKFANHYYHRRSGDIFYVLKPQYTDGDGVGADHSSIFSYDSHIPVIFYGSGIKPSKIYREVYMNDIAPTVCAKLQIEAPSGCNGKVLEEVLR